MNTLAKLVDDAINQLEAQSQPVEVVDSGPRWVSDAERGGLPTVNLVDSGAPLLKPDEVLRRSLPALIGKH